MYPYHLISLLATGWMARYDEDLHENLFFQSLVNRFGALFNEAAEKRWTIFVPRADTVSRLKLTKVDFENHVVMPTSEEGRFISLNRKSVLVEGGVVTAGHGYKELRTVKILFDECFFNSREESYQIFCLNQPLEGALGEEVILSLENVEDCIKYLWGEPGSEKVRRAADRLLNVFHLERSSSMRLILDASMALYTRVIQEVYKLKKFHSRSQISFCKLAVETYVLAALHRKIFKEVCFRVASKDAILNKITRNLSDVSPQSLGIKEQYQLRISKARAVLSQLNQFATPLEKLYCFKSCVSTLMEGESQDPLTADELLPILVFLAIITDIPNWMGNIVYITKFHFSHVATDEFTYYMTSFEAAVEYIRSEAHEIATLTSGINQVTVQKLRSSSLHDGGDFFETVCRGDVAAIRSLLKREAAEAESFKSRLCHPLCTCSSCRTLIDKQLDNSDRASVFSRDENGRTGLHHAARLGHSELASVLLEHGALPSATDHHSSTPLHLACQKGHQKVALILLGEVEKINAADNHGNTPLHLACSNGHEECVKALLFSKDQCRVDTTNNQGDSPLHNAARWGYASIVGVLLTHGASMTILNRRRESPQQCAQSVKVQELLSTVQTRRDESDLSDDSQVLRMKHVSKRMSIRGSFSEPDRQLKRLFRAVRDGDTNYVKYLFGWEEGTANQCHPLCQCEKCSQLRKSPPMAVLSINSCDPQGQTPLHKASLLGHINMVDLLLAHGAMPDVRARESQQTPLHLACQYNQQDVVLMLLEESASVNVQDVQGNSPLHFSCTNGHLDTALLLLARGADVTMSNVRGDSALHNAARWNHAPIVQLLMLYGAQYKATNNEGKTPLDLTKDEEVQKLVLMAISGELMVGRYTTPLTPSTKATPTHATNSNKPVVRQTTPTPLFPVEEEQLFTPLEDDHAPSTDHTPNSKVRDLLQAIENFDRRGTLKRTNTMDRSAPLLTSPSQCPPPPVIPPTLVVAGIM
ncbi:ankyrin repeat domain-containing protein 27-like isoform X2 [Halichondria panicea]|uniref:ankyrin repeat domain-containing protein 27-like isoform X2 n=1 Tax=Halichondria panicea TaxID=6063 RepID=UPI00312B3F17